MGLCPLSCALPAADVKEEVSPAAQEYLLRGWFVSGEDCGRDRSSP